MQHAVIVSTVRTPIGRAHKGSLAAVRPDDLLARTVAEALARVPGLLPESVDDLVVGCALPGGEQGFNIARIAAILLGWDHVPGVTVNRFCTSSLQAVRMAAQAVRCGDADVVVAAGVESQSRLAHGSSDTWPGTENPAFGVAGQRTVERSGPGTAPWSDPRDKGGTPDPYIPVGLAAENVADVYGITRTDMDAYAARSHRLTQLALAESFHFGDIVAVKSPDGTTTATDDCPRTGVTERTLAALPPRFRPDGRITVGNSAPLSDGAAAVVVMSEEYARAHGHIPLARILSTGVSAATPETEGPAPVAATRTALARAGLSLSDLDTVAGNEPFAAQVLAYCAELGLDPERMNPHGGSIALGEPYGAAGARLTTTALTALRHDDRSTALVSVVAAGGQGMAMVLERTS
ncbi:acetyl-CoA C-acyltransferase [Streptomyces sp. So13.3]|uniref:acetyl-CoA C-acyltransferase n=1 Tax=Streptomyces TaxID=1883 RepID=UPI0011067EAF|nr:MULTISPECIES: acetyl-CoA C-acyltransferase [Streptomyces]MCZ4096845.1 acetyl-CoA C-acyltransferase [Streptomyces sp. H39-C1]QNA77075.1 acetyl-CoA C-acyltransferase [Streptomyces sp. So13.3]